MKKLKILSLFVLTSLTTQLWAAKSHPGFEKTLEQLKARVKKAGLSVVAEIDHSKAAQNVGMKLPKTVLLLVGNPKIGTTIMQKNRLTALELPMKLLVWENAEGQTFIDYKSPLQAFHPYNVGELKPTFEKMENVLSELVVPN